jgi:hypothetical protein
MEHGFADPQLLTSVGDRALTGNRFQDHLQSLFSAL